MKRARHTRKKDGNAVDAIKEWMENSWHNHKSSVHRHLSYDICLACTDFFMQKITKTIFDYNYSRIFFQHRNKLAKGDDLNSILVSNGGSPIIGIDPNTPLSPQRNLRRKKNYLLFAVKFTVMFTTDNPHPLSHLKYICVVFDLLR